RWHTVHRPAQSPDSFCPVETAGFSAMRRCFWLGFIPVEQDFPRILRPRGKQDDALSALWQTKCPRVDHTICPAIAELRQAPTQVAHRVASVQLEHEGDVF